ncbi:hypothetical protein [Deinococcus cellulosilyticus]|uniref:Uncharacterized protein n=1 Tax=Deinococcus cellulosilyticus (strain DSM 18568 / NBRC 106333 / KACC 11606 / 5516J-15) TaxID=1223518 RepID=A0A511MX32_DEIC1|nr:hypothetical protein [Deinococcus cellulosilyticus]GEM45134.1 hypothetical protein DC3_07690 [Deinococcus cellulosilyticus NBRC 106333 = KACC 11606]
MKTIEINRASKVVWLRLMLLLLLGVGLTFLVMFLYPFLMNHHTELQVKAFTGSRFEIVHTLESTGFGRNGYHILSLRDPASGRSIRFLTIQNGFPGIKNVHLSGQRMVVELDPEDQEALTFCVTSEGKVDRHVQYFDGELYRIKRLISDQNRSSC